RRAEIEAGDVWHHVRISRIEMISGHRKGAQRLAEENAQKVEPASAPNQCPAGFKLRHARVVFQIGQDGNDVDSMMYDAEHNAGKNEGGPTAFHAATPAKPERISQIQPEGTQCNLRPSGAELLSERKAD